jgi:murein DD-endopeptidase MepM/ murein hydrolase activator NlpD
MVPVAGIDPDKLVRSYHDPRSGSREHEAIDILAPTGTPVVAVEDGTIAKLFFSKAGGITIYQFDPTKQFSYYYAHLDRYADGLKEGAEVHRGQVLGYVGISGNAPKNTPHLHFAVYRLTSEKRWWEGTPIDPYDILR